MDSSGVDDSAVIMSSQTLILTMQFHVVSAFGHARPGAEQLVVML
jgi:hypothetical protein